LPKPETGILLGRSRDVARTTVLRPRNMRWRIYRSHISHIVSISVIVALAACSGTEILSPTPIPAIQAAPAVEAAIEPESMPRKEIIE